MEKKKVLTMKLLKEKYGVCRFKKTEPIPSWTEKSGFFSITRTSDELSVVCDQKYIPDYVRCKKDWRVLKIEGPLDFSLIGILAPIATILAENEISIFAISTYDTDYILVKDTDSDKAVEILTKKNYKITD